MDVSIFFIFFFSGAGEREEASEEVAGGPVLIETRGRGGGDSEEEAREGEGRRGSVCGEGGGGLNIFFRGRNAHQGMGCQVNSLRLGVSLLSPFFEINPGILCSGIESSWTLMAINTILTETITSENK